MASGPGRGGDAPRQPLSSRRFLEAEAGGEAAPAGGTAAAAAERLFGATQTSLTPLGFAHTRTRLAPSYRLNYCHLWQGMLG